MIITTIDPVTGNKVSDLERCPFITEGGGVAETKIYFENDKTLQEYLDNAQGQISISSAFPRLIHLTRLLLAISQHRMKALLLFVSKILRNSMLTSRTY